MRRLAVLTMLLVIVTVTAAPPVAAGFTDVDTSNNTEEYLVHLGAVNVNDEMSAGSIRHHAESSQRAVVERLRAIDGVTVEQTFWIANVLLLTVDTERVHPASLSRLPGITEVTPHGTVTVDRVAQPTTVASTTGSYTDGLVMSNVPEVWSDFDTRGAGATVAVLDTGVDPAHPDLSVDHWRDFNDEPSSTPLDYDWHGTHVSGTIVGGAESGTHIGVAPDASLAAGAVLTDCNATTCSGDMADLLGGMQWAVDLDVDVISLSLGHEGYTPELIEAVRNANAAGSTVVAAVGNEGEGTSSSPGNVYDAIAVGAVAFDEDVPTFSSGEVIDTADAWGADAPTDWPATYVVPDVVAPGVHIESAEPGGGYRLASGTSMATPHVSGVVLLAKAASAGSPSHTELLDALTQTAWKPPDAPSGQDTRYGHGIVDAYGVVDRLADRAAIEGTVTDDVTGSPVETATVVIEGEETRTTQTDAEGGYEQLGLPGDRTYT
ncbi:MAG: S8 family serine peptidase, partial [Halobacteriota archaeon]